MRNELLGGLSEDDLKAIRPYLSSVPLRAGETIQTRGRHLGHVFFPQDGIISLMCGSVPRIIEAVLVGRNGMIGAAASLGQDVGPDTALVQLPGSALRMAVDDFRRALDTKPGLRRAVLTFVHQCLVDTSRTLVAAGKGTVHQRLSRWLLLAQDKLGRDQLELTHECLSNALGVRRPGVTVSLHILEGERAIRSKRGCITILDQDRLRALAGFAYEEQDRPASIRHTASGSAMPGAGRWLEDRSLTAHPA